MSEWTEAATVAEFEATDRKFVDLGGDQQFGLYVVDGQYYASSAWCTHEKTSLVHGDLEGHEIMCPVHGARFDLRNGRHLCLPATRALKTYPVKVEDEKIFIKC